MRIEIRADDVLAKFGRSMADLSKRARVEMSRCLHRGGEKTRTHVRRALKEQTSVKRYGAITEGTRSFLENDLEFVIQAQGKPHGTDPQGREPAGRDGRADHAEGRRANRGVEEELRERPRSPAGSWRPGPDRRTLVGGEVRG